MHALRTICVRNNSEIGTYHELKKRKENQPTSHDDKRDFNSNHVAMAVESEEKEMNVRPRDDLFAEFKNKVDRQHEQKNLCRIRCAF